MDSGLSARMSKALEELLPASAAQAPPENYNAATAIDLATGQNEVIRKELLEFFKTTIESRLTANVSFAPQIYPRFELSRTCRHLLYPTRTAGI